MPKCRYCDKELDDLVEPQFCSSYHALLDFIRNNADTETLLFIKEEIEKQLEEMK